MASTSVICFVGAIVTLLRPSLPQVLNTNRDDYGICPEVVCTTIDSLEEQLRSCVVILGNLKLIIRDRANESYYENLKFPELREVTGYVVVYRVLGLTSLGGLFPNLTRIRGVELFDNYGLIVHDMPSLIEIGLYGLIKIDRGGVVIGGGPQTCYIFTVDWNVIAPRARHVLTPPDKDVHCNYKCTCTDEPVTNHCWNYRKCQRYIENPNSDQPCHEQCFGCKRNNPSDCLLCRNYTHKDKCVPKCPEHTLILAENKYCLTEKECLALGRWIFNDTCVKDCPIDYVKVPKPDGTMCKYCTKCQSICPSLRIQSLSSLQEARRCVYINGSLTIHIAAVPDVMEELTFYLSKIQEVRDYIVIHGSITITSLHFLPSLHVINGTKLAYDAYSLIISNMENLQTLFTSNVTQRLDVKRGKLKAYSNPMLCMSKLEEISGLFKTKSNDTDIPVGMNGYSGGCAESSVTFDVKVWNATTATVVFTTKTDVVAEYTILYVKLPQGSRVSVVPETCSDYQWFAVSATTGIVDLTSLRPASTYAICIEMFSYSYQPVKRYLARSKILYFNTPFGKPKPPFVIELVASSSEVVVLRWVDHKDYHPHITRYELDVSLIEISSKDILAKDHCTYKEVIDDEDDTRHAVVLKPPTDYDRGCESMCGVLSTQAAGAMVEENFDICDSIDLDCDKYEEQIVRTNSSFGNFIRTLSLDVTGPRNDFQVGGLAPYRDYKFKLRACIGAICSRSTKEVVRTLRSARADVPVIKSLNIDNFDTISIQWTSPTITNGPVLAYYVNILPYINVESGTILPQSWCELTHDHDLYNLTVKPQPAPKYKVRICSTTLGSLSSCSEWQKIISTVKSKLWVEPEFSSTFLWAGVVFGVCITVLSIMISVIWNYKPESNDVEVIGLVDFMETNESEPPILLTDIVPFYTVPLRDTILHY